MRLRAPRSLAAQFALLHGVTALIAALMLPLGAAMLHRVAHHYQRDVLRQQAAGIATLLRDHSPAAAIEATDILAGGLTLSIVDARRRIVAQHGPSRPAMLAAVPLDRRARQMRRGALAAISLPAGGRWIVVSQDDSAPEVVADDIVDAFLARFALLLVPLIVLLPLTGVWLTRRLTRRMTAASDIAAAIGPRTLDRRLPHGTLPWEVEPLAAATNAALDRLEQAFAAQTAFAADVAHELRTPLATIRLRADAIPDPAVRAKLLAEVDRAARVITQLLVLAELERPIDGAHASVALSAVAEDVVADRAPALIAAGRRIALDDQGAPPLPGYAGAIRLALENLVDNAARYTPPGTRITVRVGPGHEISVVDDGPTIAPADLERMATRFWRAGTTRSEGFGLGLSIVQRVAAAHGGRLLIAAGSGGRGLCATLRFGRVPPL
ncbi:sensor histidine kinase [Sphingomonas sp. RIT328]|uniref:sensor histidine kinase n=1 Tax=Sphingomonas sp. RIT328 TaxID=1470591 RepID=UPI00044FE9B8|nr:ATP-binding protein [Sphingomonas sp. RIT328]EZP49024.1 Histidine kinase precursor [Sphingomonas sp. RIT328]